MDVGIALRNMGPQSTPEVMAECALAAEAAGLESIWVTDHVAIPPDDAEGSNGRYVDPLATLAYLAGRTERIRLGTGVLVLPYRPALATARWVAAVQELSGGRLLLGVGVGWMDAEFRAVGVPRARRGAVSDEVLEFLDRCWASPDDVVEANGQPFLFRPKPPKPPIYVGGAPPHALARSVRHADGWMPMGGTPEKLAPHIRALREHARESGRPAPQVVCLGPLPAETPDAAAERLRAWRDVGVTRFVGGTRYPDAAAFGEAAERLAAAARALG